MHCALPVRATCNQADAAGSAHLCAAPLTTYRCAVYRVGGPAATCQALAAGLEKFAGRCTIWGGASPKTLCTCRCCCSQTRRRRRCSSRPWQLIWSTWASSLLTSQPARQTSCSSSRWTRCAQLQRACGKTMLSMTCSRNSPGAKARHAQLQCLPAARSRQLSNACRQTTERRLLRSQQAVVWRQTCAGLGTLARFL